MRLLLHFFLVLIVKDWEDLPFLAIEEHLLHYKHVILVREEVNDLVIVFIDAQVAEYLLVHLLGAESEVLLDVEHAIHLLGRVCFVE